MTLVESKTAAATKNQIHDALLQLQQRDDIAISTATESRLFSVGSAEQWDRYFHGNKLTDSDGF